MKIKNNKINYTSFLLIISVLVILFLVSFSIGGNKNKKDKKTKTEKLDLETLTVLNVSHSIIDVIKNNDGILHQDSICNIYFIKELGIPTLLYVYKNELTNEQLLGKFKLRVLLKDPTEWEKVNKGNPKMYLDFISKPQELIIESKKYFIFKKILTHKYLDLDNVKHLNTGRFHHLDKNLTTYMVSNLTINNSNTPLIHKSNNFEKMDIYIKSNNFEKIKAKRLEAFKNRILITEDKDIVNATVSFKTTEKIKTKLRLKGDLTDHLNHPTKWSFRLIIDGGNTINGLRKFSIQHPKVRRFLWEWLFNKTIKQNELIGLKYEFIDVDLNIIKKDTIQEIPLGIMAFEESFDKILIENNKRREGIILGFDESLIWADRDKQQELNLPQSARSKKLQSFKNASIKLYNENKVLSNPKLAKQFSVAKDMLDGLRKGELKISEVFDIDKLTMFVALSNLFGGYHGISGRNLRIYYNPVTNKLEPMSWDSYSGQKINKIYNYSFSANDELYSQKLVEKLELVSSTEFVNNLVNSFSEELDFLYLNLISEFEKLKAIDLSVLEYNSNFIKKKIYPSSVIISSLLRYDTNQMDIDIENMSDFPIVINSLVHKEGKILTKHLSVIVIKPAEKQKITFRLKESFVNAFVSKKNKKGEFRYPKDLSKISVQFNMLGQEHKRTELIIPFGESENLTSNVLRYKKSRLANFNSFDFIRLNEPEKVIRFKEGSYTLKEILVIPSGYMVSVEKGFKLNFKDQASIVSYSSFVCKGTKERPIKFYSSDSTGAGIFISSAPETSIFDYCEFSNLSNPTSNIWELSGAVNFNETTVAIKNSLFENNRCEDGLNIIRSKFTLESSIFKDTKSDAFDGDFVEGSITNCEFINSGNDGVDVSGSKITLENITFENPSDKAISAGENSTINGSGIIIEGGEIGIVSKDLSRVTLSEVTISDTRLAFSSFQKKSEFGPGTITITDLTTTNIESDYLVEIGSSLTIDNLLATTVSNKVIDQMYGKEYGKSSK